MLSFLFSPKGRFSCRDFWIGLALIFAVTLLGLVGDFIVFGIGWDPSANRGQGGFSDTPILLNVAALLIFWPMVAMGIKRWHDRDRPWYFVLLGLVPLVNIYAFVVMILFHGTQGENRFGPDPREQQAGDPSHQV